jgi:hypothetical protein
LKANFINSIPAYFNINKDTKLLNYKYKLCLKYYKNGLSRNLYEIDMNLGVYTGILGMPPLIYVEDLK